MGRHDNSCKERETKTFHLCSHTCRWTGGDRRGLVMATVPSAASRWLWLVGGFTAFARQNVGEVEGGLLL